jgi:zinc transport system substrate-binding protein
MNTKKTSTFLAVFCIFGMTAFSAPSQKKLKITATFHPLYIMLENITENVPGVEISMLAPPSVGCLHDYELTTKDMKTITSCDILIANGAGMENFLEKALSMKKGAVIIAADGFKLTDDNPHVWVSPAGAVYEVQQIAAGLEKLDSVHADLYKKNTDIYVSKLQNLSSDMHKALDGFAGSRIITFHEAFPYFASEFHLQTASVVEREPGTIPNAKELAELIDQIKKTQKEGSKISLFAEPQYSSSAAGVIARETGLVVYELDPCVTGPLDKDSYINSMKQNTVVLQKALSGANGSGK